MIKISMLAIDLAKGSFQVCAIGPEGTCVDVYGPHLIATACSGLVWVSRLLTHIRLSDAARYDRRRKPRWVSAHLVLHALEASAMAVPVHTSGSRGDGP